MYSHPLGALVEDTEAQVLYTDGRLAMSTGVYQLNSGRLEDAQNSFVLAAHTAHILGEKLATRATWHPAGSAERAAVDEVADRWFSVARNRARFATAAAAAADYEDLAVVA